MRQNYYFNPNQLKSQMVKKRHIEKQKEEQWIGTSLKVAILLSCMALHDKEGFGEKRLVRFIKQIEEYLDSVDKGFMTIEDANNVLGEEVGIAIQDMSLRGFK